MNTQKPGAALPERDAANLAIGKTAVRGLAWSVVQNWGGRFLTFVLFVILARVLAPSDFGLASAAQLVVLFIGLVAEFGFGSAIVQRPNIVASDINLPFYASVVCAICLTALACASANTIQTWLGVPGLRPVLIAVSVLSPLTTISLFQEANYRRHFAFRELAFRVLAANLLGGTVAIVCAYSGIGVWSLVLQSYIIAAIGIIWLWRKPYWVPGRALKVGEFREMALFGIPIAAMRVIDFAAVRFVDVVVIARFGVAALGLYAVGSQIYQSLMQLLQAALNDVALAVLSRIAGDRDRVAEIYIRGLLIGAYAVSPIFVFLAVVLPDVCVSMFGAKWSGVGTILQPLLLIGAVNCIQYLNSPYLNARGKPSLVLIAGLIKSGAVISALLFIPSHNLTGTIAIYVIAQLVSAPLSFGFTARELGIPIRRVLTQLAPALAASAFGYLAAWEAGRLLHHGSLLKVTISGALFVLIYFALVLLLGRAQIGVIQEFVQKHLPSSVVRAAQSAIKTVSRLVPHFN